MAIHPCGQSYFSGFSKQENWDLSVTTAEVWRFTKVLSPKREPYVMFLLLSHLVVVFFQRVSDVQVNSLGFIKDFNFSH